MDGSRLRGVGGSAKSILLNQYSAVIFIAAVVGIAGFISNIPAFWWGEYVVGIGLVFTLLGYHDKRVELQNLKDSNHIILRRREASILVLEKEIDVEVNESEFDVGTYDLNLTSAFDETQIKRFPALLKTDIDVTWSDLNFSVENAYPVEDERERTSDGDEKSFLLPCEFEYAVSRPEHYEMSYSIENDLVDPEEDWVSLVVREPTRVGKIRVELPEGWEIETRRCYDIPLGEDEKELGDDRYFNLGEDGRVIEWSRADPEIGHEYRVKWTATKIEE